MKPQFDNYHLTNAYSIWMSDGFSSSLPLESIEKGESTPHLFLFCPLLHYLFICLKLWDVSVLLEIF